MTKQKELQPLQELLDSVVARLDALEHKVGLPLAAAQKPRAVSTSSPPPPPAASESPAVKAYDAFLENSVAPLVAACNDLEGLARMGPLLRDAWGSLRSILVLASRSKMPDDDVATELQPHLQPTMTAVQEIRALRLDRTYDDHCKAIVESLTCLSWILIRPPPQTPAAFCKEAMASCEYWSNKIRKQFKNTNEKHIAFCNALQQCLKDLVDYITEHHKTGLSWNPRGVSLAEASVTMSSLEKEMPPPPLMLGSPKSPRRHRPFTLVSGGIGSTRNLMAELEKKRTADGNSAATGLKHVSRDQQTWRKEYKGEKTSVLKATANKAPPKKDEQQSAKKKLTGVPICEYQERGHKWVVEHQTKERCGGQVLKVEVSDPKQQVYIFNCHDVTVQIEGGGKVKSVIMDKCERCNVVFGTAISGCELVNCKKIQVQTLGVCPSFSIDKTEGCLVYLSKESLDISSFVTCQSTEMNVSFPHGEEQKEVPIPEQFVHKLKDGSVTSEVSDLYH